MTKNENHLCKSFEWDSGNRDKNWQKHKVTFQECEETFFNTPFIVKTDSKHSQKESRYYALGKTNSERKLFLVFTLRGENIRVISARDMNKKEKVIYENEEKKDDTTF